MVKTTDFNPKNKKIYQVDEQAYVAFGKENVPNGGKMIFRQAQQQDLSQIHALYRSLVGRPYCTWDETYPDWIEINEDYENGGLYVMAEGAEIVGAISIVSKNELDELPFWRSSGAKEIARVAVAPGQQRKGIASQMTAAAIRTLKAQGIPAIHLLVAKGNPPAQQVYRKNGFAFLGECFQFGHDFFACEKIL